MEPESRLYDGLTLDEWRVRIKDLDPADPSAAEAVPGLIAIVRDGEAPWYSRRQAALTLGRIGAPAAEAVSVLTKLLDDAWTGEEAPRLWAIRSLTLFGPVARSATPKLVAIVHDESRPIVERLMPLDALGSIGTADPDAVATLTAMLGYRPAAESKVTANDAALMRAIAAQALGTMGAGAKSTVPALIRAVRDDTEIVRIYATATLGAIGAAAEIAIPTLVELLVLDESEAVRDNAARSLSQIGPAAIGALEHLLSDREAGVRWRAALSLGRMGPRGAPAVDSLLRLRADSDSNVRMHAVEALWNITGDVAMVADAALCETASEDRQIRIRAVRLLSDMGRKSDDFRLRLRDLADDERPHIQHAARQALQKIWSTE